jgi:F-type H+-transporting ATPase subunit epsilon
MGVLAKRAPIITALDIAPLKVTTDKGIEEFAVHGGVLKMDGDVLLIISDAAENVREIDVYRAEIAKKRAMDRLEKAKSDIERARSKASIQKNLLRETLGQKR